MGACRGGANKISRREENEATTLKLSGARCTTYIDLVPAYFRSRPVAIRTTSVQFSVERRGTSCVINRTREINYIFTAWTILFLFFFFR